MFQSIPFIKPPVTADQVKLLKRDNVVGPQAAGFKELGITPTALEPILPTYLDRYRPARLLQPRLSLCCRASMRQAIERVDQRAAQGHAVEREQREAAAPDPVHQEGDRQETGDAADPPRSAARARRRTTGALGDADPEAAERGSQHPRDRKQQRETRRRRDARSRACGSP